MFIFHGKLWVGQQVKNKAISLDCTLYTDKLALLYNFTSVYTNIPFCRREESKRGNICIFTSICTIKFLYHDH